MKPQQIRFLIAAAVIVMISGCGKDALIKQTVADTPENNYAQGKDFLADEDLSSARASFERAVGLDAKFAPGYEGLALVSLAEGSLKDADKMARKSLSLDIKAPAGHVAYGRVLAAKGDLRAAHSKFRRAQKLDPKYLDSYFYQGQAYEDQGLYDEAESSYKKCQDIDRTYSRALKAWEKLQVTRRASAGMGPEYRKIARLPVISRADLSALLINELKLEKHIKRPKMKEKGPGFETPGQASRSKKSGAAMYSDLADSWARGFIQRIINLGIMEGYPDGTFRPTEEVTKGEFAMILTRVMVSAFGDEKLETQFVGQSSPYSDISDSSPVLNSVLITSSRSILKANMDGTFGVGDAVAGNEAIIALKKLESILTGN